ncbi:MAG: hypothetical protein ACE5JR_11345 [Gemmatimonadota bacterium]
MCLPRRKEDSGGLGRPARRLRAWRASTLPSVVILTSQGAAEYGASGTRVWADLRSLGRDGLGWASDHLLAVLIAAVAASFAWAFLFGRTPR